ncbi:hypothetical protein PAXINDRAFT_18486 [Paxillus involutus ATCC 200175]|uniref:Uncharacterized protein n=1 Tax=Paxillus involutus ATCC 200175 TaxID=664439 RepID=A0A0C9SNR9_PAXIN|nr:hypothetical protein PAXINDRAFT_18486 [Paxillus involutus ATCC 200175]
MKVIFSCPRPANQAAHPFVHTSIIFLPHPNAPKVSYQSQGPMYGRTATLPHSNPAPPDLRPTSPTMCFPPHNPDAAPPLQRLDYGFSEPHKEANDDFIRAVPARSSKREPEYGVSAAGESFRSCWICARDN